MTIPTIFGLLTSHFSVAAQMSLSLEKKAMNNCEESKNTQANIDKSNLLSHKYQNDTECLEPELKRKHSSVSIMVGT